MSFLSERDPNCLTSLVHPSLLHNHWLRLWLIVLEVHQLEVGHLVKHEVWRGQLVGQSVRRRGDAADAAVPRTTRATLSLSAGHYVLGSTRPGHHLLLLLLMVLVLHVLLMLHKRNCIWRHLLLPLLL